jgi:hypothetical protein
MEGYIKLHRKILNNKYWLEPRRKSKFEAWIYLLLRAGYKNKEFVFGDADINLKAGEFITSQLKLAEAWKWDRETVGRHLARLQSDGQITYKTSNKFTIISICNWDSYQNQDKLNPATNPATKPTTIPTTKPTQTIKIKKDKKEKNKKLFLDFVLLTDEEYKKLLNKFGEQGTKDRIEKLNNYIGSKGTRYKSHYYTILTWDNRDRERPHVISQEKDSLSKNKVIDDKFLNEKIGRIATKDMIKSVLQDIPQDLWWKVNKFLQKQYPGGGNGFVEAERELIQEARGNIGKLKELTKGIGKIK